MIGSWELAPLDISAQFFAFSRLYLRSSLVLCAALGRLRSKPLYPAAAVVLYLAQHAVELFLKGAVLARAPQEELHHKLEDFKRKFDALYPEPRFAWSLPFQTEYIGLTPEQTVEAKKRRVLIDQIYRYPVDTTGTLWPDAFAIDQKSLMQELRQLARTLNRLARTVSTANQALQPTPLRVAAKH